MTALLSILLVLAAGAAPLTGARDGDRRFVIVPHRAPSPAAAAVRAPRIRQWRIPYGARRRAEMAAYSARHYGRRSFLLVSPHVIVEHYADADSARAVFNTFAPDVADPELHEKPNVCAHYVVDRDGTIYQLVPLRLRCRHTVGLNYTAIGIEHAGFSDAEVLTNGRQLAASLRLTRYLRCRFRIHLRDVIGHNESLSSPYHHERVRRLRGQTHGDFRRASMVRYRRRLARLRCV